MKKKLICSLFLAQQFNFLFIVPMIYESKAYPTVVRERGPG
jgi:hypothetical protein